MDLINDKISYMLLSSDKIDDVVSVLYAKNYQIIPIRGYYQGEYEESALAFSDVDNDELRKDAIFLLNHFDQDCGIIKYLGENIAKKIYPNGSEKPMGVVMYNTDSENISYLYNGFSFSFVEQVRYWIPKSKEDFKIGMVVEYLNNNKWYQKKVENPDEEWNSIWKLFTKYDKVRVASI
jgi:hypothetical protein